MVIQYIFTLIRSVGSSKHNMSPNSNIFSVNNISSLPLLPWFYQEPSSIPLLLLVLSLV